MNRFLAILLLLPLAGRAAIIFPPASQTEVNAGTIRTKFVSPLTLAGWSGTVPATATNAIAFLNGKGTNTVFYSTGNSNAIIVNGPVLMGTNGNITIGDSVNLFLVTNWNTTIQNGSWTMNVSGQGTYIQDGAFVSVENGSVILVGINTGSGVSPSSIRFGSNDYVAFTEIDNNEIYRYRGWTDITGNKTNQIMRWWEASNIVANLPQQVLNTITASRAVVFNAQGRLTNAAGTPDGTKFLRDDNTYAVPAGGAASGSNFFGIVVTNTIERQWVWQGFDTNQSLDFSKTNIIIIQPSNTTTLAFANLPSAGSPARSMTLWVYWTNASGSIVFPSGIDWRGITPALVTGLTNIYSFAWNGTNLTGFAGQDYTTGTGQTYVLQGGPTLSNTVTIVGTTGGQEPQIKLQNTTVNGYVSFSNPPGWVPTNNISWLLSNIVAGQFIKINAYSVSSGVGQVDLVNVAAPAQTPWTSDINGGGFALTNALKLTLGSLGTADAGTQSPALILAGTNSSGQTVLSRIRGTNSTFTIDHSVNGAAYGSQSTFSSGGTFTSASHIVSGGDVSIPNGSRFYWSTRAGLLCPADGEIVLANNAFNSFTRLDFGSNNAVAPALQRLGAGLQLIGGAGVGSISNHLHVAGNVYATNGLQVGINGGLITNVMTASATLDFPSTSVGAVADLPITVSGAADGDVVQVGSPVGATGPIAGSYSGFASNGVAYVRFTPTAAAQDPASGTFKVIVSKF